MGLARSTFYDEPEVQLVDAARLVSELGRSAPSGPLMAIGA